MRRLTIQIAPFFAGALIGLGFGIGVTRHGNWPNAHYRILEMEPMARNLSLIGLLLLGSGFGCVFASMLMSSGYGDFEIAPTDDANFAWQSFSVTVSLLCSGLLFLAIGIYILS